MMEKSIRPDEEEEKDVLLPYTDERGYSWMAEYGRGLGAFEDMTGESAPALYGYIDQNGEWKVPMKYDEAYYFNNGMACVVKEGQYGYINENGEEVIEIQYDWASDFMNGASVVSNSQGKMGYVDDKGNTIIKFKYDGVIPYDMREEGERAGLECVNSEYYGFNTDGYAPAYKDGKLYYVTKDGTEITLKE